jgi:peptide/nickel transport system ATP-binding protein
MTEPLLHVDHLRVAYPGRGKGVEEAWTIDDVSFVLNPGERMGLVGESGCGKSTLGRALMRLLPLHSRIEGQLWWQGRSLLEFSESELRRFRGEAVGLVFQDPMTRLDPLMTIGEHCLETLQSHQPQLSAKQAKSQALAVLDAVKIPAQRWSQFPHEFSGGMRQRVAIALALLLEPQLIIADEPTTALDVTVSAQIMQELTRLCAERQMGLLLISHDLAMVAEYCDRMAVMYAGQFVETGTAATVLQHPEHAYTRSLLAAALHVQVEDTEVGKSGTDRSEAQVAIARTDPEGAIVETQPTQAGGPTILLKLQNLEQHYTLEQNVLARIFSGAAADRTIRAVDDVSLDLYAGETLGLVGESGCGKSTLSRTILQLVRPTGGRVEFLGQDLARLDRHGLQQQRRQMQMVFQDPHACLNPMMTVGESVGDPLVIHRLATGTGVKAAVLEMLERVGLVPAASYYRRFPGELSGGQQQRVAIARALITRPQLLICDEPVSMLDAHIQAQVLELMRELKAEFQLTYLFITHDLWVARFFCDRIAVMNAGKIVELGPTESVFRQPQHEYTKTLLAAAPLLARRER